MSTETIILDEEIRLFQEHAKSLKVSLERAIVMAYEQDQDNYAFALEDICEKIGQASRLSGRIPRIVRQAAYNHSFNE